MKKWYGLLFFALLSVLFFQCQKEASFIGGADAGASVGPDPITTSIQGNITDENDQPAIGVAITAGTSTAITDANGYFHIVNAALDKNTTLVTAQKDGYFKGYRVLAATSGCNQVAIKLIKKNIAATVASASGGDATLSNGAKVGLPANGVVVASSNGAYSGDVNVYAAYINPKGDDIAKTVPGSFVANDKNGKRVTLASYGMLAVELYSSGGEKLQIKTGSVATLSIPIPAASVSSAPANISLWYVDETTGIWQEEGTATKQGNNYVGQVKHFSFWNCDFQYSAVTLSFTLQTPAGLPLVNATVKLSGVLTDTSAAASSAYGFTDSLGQVKGLVPANTNLTLEVFGACGNTVIYSQNIAPLMQDKDLGIIKINDGTSYLLTLTGTVLNCSNAPVTNGYAIVTLDGIRHNAATDANGKFTTTYVTCSSSTTNIFISGVDADAQQQGNQTEMTVVLPLADVGNITACGSSTVEQYLNYTIDRTSYSITSANGDSLRGYETNETNIYGYTLPSASPYLAFKSFTSGAAGTFTLHALSIKQGDTVQASPSNVTFTKFPTARGEFYEGNFSGTFIDSNISHTISATFRIKQN